MAEMDGSRTRSLHLRAHKQASIPDLVGARGHRLSDLLAQAVELLEHHRESRITNRLNQILTLDPEGSFVPPGRPARILRGFVRFLVPSSRKTLVFRNVGEVVQGDGCNGGKMC